MHIDENPFSLNLDLVVGLGILNISCFIAV